MEKEISANFLVLDSLPLIDGVGFFVEKMISSRKKFQIV